MKFTHVQTAQMPNGDVLQDSGTEYNGRAMLSIDETVPANGAGANGVLATIPSAGVKAIFLLATVPCTVTFTGSNSAPVLVANQLTKITALNADVTAISIGANSTSSGPAGAVKIRVLYDS